MHKYFPISYQISNNNIHIQDSYKISSKKHMQEILEHIVKEAEQQDIYYFRRMSSWISEWQAHNWLFERGYKQDRTGSVDLNEDESFVRIIFYKIISLFYRFPK